MKKLFLVGALAFFGAMNAQTEKGSWIAGGSTTLGFNSATTKSKSNYNSSDGPKVSSFAVTPSVGYFVINKLAIGIDFGFNSRTTKQQDVFGGDIVYDSKFTVTSLSVMPTATYYFKSDSKLLPYLGAGLGFASTKAKSSIAYSSDDIENKNNGFTWKAKGGLVYLITPSIGIDLGISFNQTSSSQDYPNYVYNGSQIVESGTYEVKTIDNAFGVNAGFSFFFK